MKLKNINYCHETKEVLSTIINGETIVIFTFFGDGGRQRQELERHAKVMEWQQKVFEHLNIPINYVYNNFNQFDFGQALDFFTQSTINNVDYWIHFDIDAIPLNGQVLNEIYDKIKDKKTVWGCASQSNHIIVNGSKQHAYCNSSTFALSTKLYKALNFPSFRHSIRGDVAEEITWKAQELGYTISLVYPTSFDGVTNEEAEKYQIGKDSDLDNGFKFGMGTLYSDMIYHATMQIVPRSTDLFINKCNQVVNQSLINKESLLKGLKTLPVAFMGGIGYDKGYGPDGKAKFNIRDSCIQMLQDVIEISNPKNILEFGTQGGCSSYLMLALSNANITSIDLCNGTGNIEWEHSYIDYEKLDARPGMKEIVRLLNEWFPNRFRFIAGSSYDEETIKKYSDIQYDLVFIDGDHSFHGCRADCQTALRLNIPYILVDDYTSSKDIQNACNIEGFELVKIYYKIHNVSDIGMALFKNKNINNI